MKSLVPYGTFVWLMGHVLQLISYNRTSSTGAKYATFTFENVVLIVSSAFQHDYIHRMSGPRSSLVFMSSHLNLVLGVASVTAAVIAAIATVYLVR